MKYLLLSIALLTACKEAAPGSDIPLPPPIAKGKCLADQYVGPTAIRQSCIYSGYDWACRYAGNYYTCDRGAESGGERPKAAQ